MNGTFGCAVNCIDGRAQTPVIEWVKFHAGVQYVDMITEPGADGVLAKEEENKTEQIYRKIQTSVNAHHPSLIAICGHSDCVGNPVSDGEHLHEITDAAAIVAKWVPEIRVVGLFVNEFGAVDLVCDSNETNPEIKNYL